MLRRCIVSTCGRDSTAAGEARGYDGCLFTPLPMLQPLPPPPPYPTPLSIATSACSSHSQHLPLSCMYFSSFWFSPVPRAFFQSKRHRHPIDTEKVLFGTLRRC
jgi:hypothetical protein